MDKRFYETVLDQEFKDTIKKIYSITELPTGYTITPKEEPDRKAQKSEAVSLHYFETLAIRLEAHNPESSEAKTKVEINPNLDSITDELLSHIGLEQDVIIAFKEYRLR